MHSRPDRLAITEPNLHRIVFDDFVHTRGADPGGNDRLVFKNHEPVRFHNHHDDMEKVYNHRNRDKNLNLWFSQTSENPLHRPIVLRFSRQGGGRKLADHFRPNVENAFYREVPEEFSNIFGFEQRNKNRVRNRRWSRAAEKIWGNGSFDITIKKQVDNQRSTFYTMMRLKRLGWRWGVLTLYYKCS